MVCSINNVYRNLNSNEIVFQNQRENFCKEIVHLVSVPKSGTNLLASILHFLQADYFVHWKHLTNKFKQISNAKPFNQVFDPNRKFLILYRDPRDLVISRIFWKKNPKNGSNCINDKEFMNLSMNEQIDQYLRPDQSEESGLCMALQMALIIKQKKQKGDVKNMCLLRFEDLIPLKAGGPPDTIRFKTFRRICKFAGVSPDTDKIKHAMKACWGDTGTFRKSDPKKVGQWKKYFSPEQVKLFKEKYNHLILGLGYETDPNWDEKYLESLLTEEKDQIAEVA